MLDVSTLDSRSKSHSWVKDISALGQLCADPSVATRITAGDAIHKLLCMRMKEGISQSAELLESLWASSVLPLVHDLEVRCSERAIDMVFEVVIGPLVKTGKDRSHYESITYHVHFTIQFYVLYVCMKSGLFTII